MQPQKKNTRIEIDSPLCAGKLELKWHKETKTYKEYGQLNYFFKNNNKMLINISITNK